MSKALKPLNTLRKSLPNSSKSAGSTFTLQPKSPEIMNPPKKVIKALCDYTARSPEELSFVKGDFFMVVANENDDFWYLASNPNTKVRGLVPVSHFQVVSKRRESSPAPATMISQMNMSHHQMAHMVHPMPQNPALSHLGPNGEGSASGRRNSRARQPQIFGTVLYDFHAERPDELAAKTGDHVIIIAQSNQEWFVAKPISKIGGPGLIPVSFVQIRDLRSGEPVTDFNEMLRANNINLPGVQEWKRETMEQDRQHIPLGVVSNQASGSPPGPPLNASSGSLAGPAPQRASHASVGSAGSQTSRLPPVDSGDGWSYPPPPQSHSQLPPMGPSTSNGSRGAEPLPHSEPPVTGPHAFSADDVTAISVVSYKNKMERFYFQIQMVFRDEHQRILFRLYEEFYEFHVQLLDEFPREAGRMDEPRSLPLMPGPLSFVNETITAQRRSQLDEYLHNLFKQPSYILNSTSVQTLLAPRREEDIILAPSSSLQAIGQPGLRPVGAQDDRHRSVSSSVSAAPTLVGDNSGRASHYESGNPLASSATLAGHGYAADPRSRSGSDTNGPRPSGYPAHTSPGQPTTLLSPIESSNASPASGMPPSLAVRSAAGSGSSSIKVKVMYNDDLVAMRLTLPLTLTLLQERISDRFNIHVGSLAYRDHTGEFVPVHSNDDLQDILSDETHRTRLTVRVTSL
ncbi:bud emergence protein 1 [Dimargaris xerosporica]|nr:bud emergence protein 1 [Dimargaris xerosporica]